MENVNSNQLYWNGNHENEYKTQPYWCQSIMSHNHDTSHQSWSKSKNSYTNHSLFMHKQKQNQQTKIKVQQQPYMHRIASIKCSPWKIAIFAKLNLYFSCAKCYISYIVQFVRKRLLSADNFSNINTGYYGLLFVSTSGSKNQI